jgi:hypothetical protein
VVVHEHAVKRKGAKKKFAKTSTRCHFLVPLFLSSKQQLSSIKKASFFG